MCDCEHQSLMEMYLANCSPKLPLCTVLCSSLGAVQMTNTTSVPEDIENRILSEDCHHSHHCNSAKVTRLLPGFYQCSQKQTVCEKWFSSQDSCGGRMHSSVFPYIALERALCSGKHQGQPTVGKQRLPAWRGWEDGAAATTSLSRLLYKQHAKKYQRKLTHPEPTLPGCPLLSMYFLGLLNPS